MSSTTSIPEDSNTELSYEPGVFGAILSFLIPGLGQISQGRIAKGILFFLCINILFYYGQFLGQWKNVYLPRAKNLPVMELKPMGFSLKIPNCLSYRMQYGAQFWVGASAWPAIYQWSKYDEDEDCPADPILGKYQRTPPETELNLLQNRSDRAWDLGWVYTVIAGLLNIMVIYDAFAGPVPAQKNKDTRIKG
jgi:hypothetical protein